MSWSEVLRVSQNRGFATAHQSLGDGCWVLLCSGAAFCIHMMPQSEFVQFWNASSGVVEMFGDAHLREINRIAVSPHKNIAVTVAEDNRINCWTFKVCDWLSQFLDSPLPETCLRASHNTRRATMPVRSVQNVILQTLPKIGGSQGYTEAVRVFCCICLYLFRDLQRQFV